MSSIGSWAIRLRRAASDEYSANHDRQHRVHSVRKKGEELPLQECTLLWRISNRSTLHMRERRKLVLAVATFGQNFDNGNVPHGKRVRNKGAMAAPRHGLGAHNGGASLSA